MGADAPACAALAGGADVKAFFVRKETKAHGLQRQIEGPPLEPGERCLIVEDVVTTGGSTVQAIEAVREAGTRSAASSTILDRLAGGAEAIARGGGRRAVRAARHDRRRVPGPAGPRRPLGAQRSTAGTCGRPDVAGGILTAWTDRRPAPLLPAPLARLLGVRAARGRSARSSGRGCRGRSRSAGALPWVLAAVLAGGPSPPAGSAAAAPARPAATCSPARPGCCSPSRVSGDRAAAARARALGRARAGRRRAASRR